VRRFASAGRATGMKSAEKSYFDIKKPRFRKSEIRGSVTAPICPVFAQ
jgi:hypothetical protein